ncbi:MAG: hypothetical protein IJ022_04385 [Burkholderiaceae bacterium]|nr:hypothetical protein [Burkholderiaceae bacterium]
MRRDVVTQVIVQYADGCENFATVFEAECYINTYLSEEEPIAAWLEVINGPKKYDFVLVEEGGEIHLV